jgi:hypothetical protein
MDVVPAAKLGEILSSIARATDSIVSGRCADTALVRAGRSQSAGDVACDPGERARDSQRYRRDDRADLRVDIKHYQASVERGFDP